MCTSHLVFNAQVTQVCPHKLSRHTSRTRVWGDTRERGARNKPTASPSYHGRRGATRGKTPTASPGTAGQPHQVTPKPPIWGRSHPTLVTGWKATSAKGVQAPRVTIVTEHTRLTIVTDTGSPHVGSTYTLSHLYPSAFYEDSSSPSTRRCNSVLVFSAHHLEDGRDGDLIGLAIPEECRGFPCTCCQDDAYRRAGGRKRGGSSSPERLQSASVCILVAQQRQHAADSLKERGACVRERVTS